MATDATGTPTSQGIPTYLTNTDAPSGKGFNAAMVIIDTLITSALKTPFKKAGALIATRRSINFIDGAGITITVADDGANDAANVTIASTVTGLSFNRQVADYTLVLADNGKVVEGNKATALAFTVPPNSSVAFPVGTTVTVSQYGAGQLSIAAGAGVTIRAIPGLKLAGQYAMASLIKVGTDEWYLAGNLTA